MERGRRHEDEFLESLERDRRDVLRVETDRGPELAAAETEAAMRAGREVIHQACFLHDGWVGYADFLVRIEQPSALGGFSYECTTPSSPAIRSPTTQGVGALP